MSKGHLVITGSAGFIGGYMVQEALDKGYRVTGLDNFSKYGSPVRSFDSHPNYKLVVGEATDVELLTDLLSTAETLVTIC